MRLLARSATGAPITTYTSHFTKPSKNKELHIVLLDGGRSKILNDNSHWKSLKCIRCAACMNTCPVYRRSGGYSYNFVIPGPIGSILAPSHGMDKHKTMPFASTLCGSCSNICPVKINIHEQLLHWRQEINQKEHNLKLILVNIFAMILANARYSNVFSHILRFAYRCGIPKLKWLNPWYKDRELPDLPAQTFKQWFKQNRGN